MVRPHRVRSSLPAVTLVLALALVMAACAGDLGTSPSASPSSAAASASPSSEAAPPPSTAASPQDLPIGEIQDLRAGTYSLAEFPVAITLEIPAFEPPAEWFSCSESAVEQAVCHRSIPDVPPAAVTFQIVDNVVAGCADQGREELLDPPVGPSVDALVAAISSLEGYTATAPENITVSGFPGVEFTLTAPDTEGCGATWATAERTTGMGPGEVNLLRIVDVDGVRVVIAEAYHPGDTPEADVDAVERVMDTIQIES